MTAMLIKNELFKVFRLRKLYIFMAILAVIEIVTILTYKLDDTTYTVITTPNGQSFPLALLNGLAQFMVIYIPIYLGDIITDEYKSGTLKLSLMHPVNRIELLHAKMISLFIFVILMVSFFLTSSYLVGTIAFGWGDNTGFAGIVYTPTQGLFTTLLSSLSLLLPYMGYGMIAVFIAVSSKNATVTIGLSIGIMTCAQYFEVFERLKNFSIVHHMYFFHESFIRDISLKNISINTLCIITYMIIFYVGSVRVLKKKDLLL